MGCTSTSVVCTCYCYDTTGNPYNWDCGSQAKKDPKPEECCPDPCTEMKLIDVQRTLKSQNTKCTRDTRNPPNPLYGIVGSVGICSKMSIVYTYDCIPIDPPPPDCTTTSSTSAPPSDCTNGGSVP